ncbi:MAG: DNA repair protein RecO [Clostridia bacterium]|nr:DNA repair protein RecO [Clostridia bacterium]
MSGHARQYSIDGLVLRESAYGENDCMFSLLTAERGRITVLAKGARSMKSRVRGGIQPYTYGNYEIAEKSGPGWIRSVSVTESFFGLRAGLLPLMLAAYLSDIACELSGEGVPADELLQLTLNTLYLLSNRIRPDDEEEILRIKAAYELRAMAISGYAPELSCCTRCGKEAPSGDGWYLDVMNGAVLCAECIKKASASREPLPDPHETGTATILIPISSSALSAMQYVQEAPPKRVFSFSLPDTAAREELSRASEAYLEHHLERTFESLKFFHTVRKG